MQSLGEDLESIDIVKQIAGLQEIIYQLCNYKKLTKHGIDKNADFRQKEKRRIEIDIKELQKDAENMYNLKFSSYTRTNVENSRFLKTQQSIFAKNADLASLLDMVRKDNKEELSMADELLKDLFIKKDCIVCKENIDTAKIDRFVDEVWEATTDRQGKKKQSSKLKSSARQGLINSIVKTIRIVAEYVRLRTMPEVDVESSSYVKYLQIKDRLIKLMGSSIESLKSVNNKDQQVLANIKILENTIDELKKKIEWGL